MHFIDDKLKEECGVIGVYVKDENLAARLAYYGLYALQHRGQESAGITVNNEGVLESAKGMGLVSEIFDEQRLSTLKGNIAIGHVRYSTSGDKEIENCQPVTAKSKFGQIALAHNGNLTNSEGLRDMLEEDGAVFHTNIDSESILKLIARQYRRGIEIALKHTISLIKGGYALIVTTKQQLIGVRDPHGLRPLCLGQRADGSYILASESCALDVIDAEFIRDIEPGEVVIIDENGLKSIPATHWGQKNLCVFELIYLARPDSTIDDFSVFEFRRKSGEILANEFKAQADIVIPVPDSGIPAAIGFANASGIPYMEGLVKNRYVGRTFIQPTQELRETAVKLKLSPLRFNLKDKRVIMIDDSIVRGTTSKRIVEQVKKAGAKEVHLCITSPPVKYSCYYGIDTPSRKHLIGAVKSIDEIREYLGADSLTYLSLAGLSEACNGEDGFCRACFNGKYPIEVPMEPNKIEESINA
ncbi:MAG: amidophosphoribosyltransferase [Epulopiscium sp. Nele67-Bin002]|nr:MAG: amidophosphoribosyltransferase [Epulopiscium sp. Nuni2H_MBin001]OON92003.1 MAG: amidophosphoribosyltransferase [Epulopiscium sp. Nele67-Bin002]